MIAIPNMEKPQNITRCSIKINPEECECVYTDKVFEETLALILDHPCPDCPLIDIVTCGECKWYNPWHANHTNLDGNHCRYIDRPMKPTDFCSYGERRT